MLDPECMKVALSFWFPILLGRIGIISPKDPSLNSLSVTPNNARLLHIWSIVDY
jgi:hypothetical protein